MKQSPWQFDGLWIPLHIFDHPDLSGTEKLLVAEILNLSVNGPCYASNSFFAKRHKVSPKQIENWLRKLRAKGIIETVQIEGRKRSMRVLIDPPSNRGVEPHQIVGSNPSNRGVQTHQIVGLKNASYNNENTGERIGVWGQHALSPQAISEEDRLAEAIAAEDQQPTDPDNQRPGPEAEPSLFPPPPAPSGRSSGRSATGPKVRPARDEALAYAATIDLPGDEVDAWFDYQDAAGWKAGRNPMKDWRASLRTWKRNGLKWRPQRERGMDRNECVENFKLKKL